MRQAVIDANALPGADTIVFDAAVFSTPQTITLASVITINGVNDTLTITGPGEELLTVSGNNAVRIFTVNSGEITTISGIMFTAAVTGAISNSGDLTVTDCAFDANTNSSGGAIVGGSNALTVTNCSFTNNINTGSSVNVPGGAAIFSNAASTVITNCTFSNNTATTGAGGGAIQLTAGSMTITDSTFTGNSTTATGQNARGGAIALTGGGQLTINNCVLTGNASKKEGGAIYYQPNASSGPFLVINDSTISNNIANSDNNTTGSGGGLFLAGTGSVTISGCTISGNTAMGSQQNAAGYGGGISASAILTLTNTTISGNSAGRDGGGIIGSGTSSIVLTIESCTIVGNTATGSGGGLDRFSATNPVNLHNTIVANNTATGTGPDIFGTVISQGYNLIKDTTGATITGDTTGNIHFQDPVLGPLADNGGPTQTHVLLSGSPAIDAGDPSNFPATDQRGLDRPYDGNNDSSARADIGAFEAGPITFVSAVSRKTHGPAGDFDLPLVLDPPGSGTVEPRAGGPTTLIFTFSDNAAAADGTLDANDFTISNATFSSASISGDTLILNLSAVVNASVVGVSLNGITSISGVNISGDNDLEVRALIGDVSGNGAVNRTDVAQTKFQSGAAATNANFREDVDLSGGIDGTDVSQVKLSVGSAVPSFSISRHLLK